MSGHGTSCDTEENKWEKAKTRHVRFPSDLTNLNEKICHNSNNNNTNNKPYSPICRRCCRQSMWSHKFRMGFTASTWGFLSSVERAVILPTLWLYLKIYWGLEAATVYYGTTLAAFSLSILVMTPLYGCAAYAGFRVKTLLLLANLMEIIGNLIYLFAPVPMAVILGRLISGVGASCEPPLYADIVRATNKDERTKFIIVLLLTRQIGLIFGPSFTLMMDNMDYHVANITIGVYNGPGLLMAILWLLHSFIIIFLYPNLDQNGRLVFSDNSTKRCTCFNTDQNVYSAEVDSDHCPILSSNSTDSLNRVNVSVSSSSLKSYCSYNILSLYVATFATYFCFMGLEAALPPVANQAFNWTERETSYVYLGASVLIIFVVIVLRILNNYYSDRVLLLSGLIVMVISYCWLTIVIYLQPTMSMPASVALTLTGIGIHVIGLPFAFAYSESLYTKLAPISDMDRAQSIFRTVINVAFLAGPYIGGTLVNAPYLVFLQMTILSVVPTLFVICRFRDFNVIDRPNDATDMESAKLS